MYRGIKCCQNCTERYPLCHSECKIYIGEKAKADERKQALIDLRGEHNNYLISKRRRAI